jgi:hypothetical protein
VRLFRPEARRHTLQNLGDYGKPMSRLPLGTLCLLTRVGGAACISCSGLRCMPP